MTLRACITVALLLESPIFVGCSTSEEEAPSPSNSFSLTEPEVAELTSAANGGSVEAMNRLANYYGIHEQDVPKQLSWLERAADAGDMHAREFLIGYYSESGLPEQRDHGERLRKKWREK